MRSEASWWKTLAIKSTNELASHLSRIYEATLIAFSFQTLS